MRKQSQGVKTFMAVFFIAAFLMMANFSGYAVTKTATMSGNWSNPILWSPAGVPASTDNIVIPAGITVTYDVNVFIGSGGSITISGVLNCSGSADSIIVLCGGFFTVNSVVFGGYISVTDGVNFGWVHVMNAFIYNPCSSGFTPGNFTVGVSGCGPTGISENPLQNSLTVSPNPFNEKLDIEISVNKLSDISYTIFDLFGKEIKTFNRDNFVGEFKESENFQNLSSGVYFLQLTLDDKTITRKLVRQ